MEENMLLNKNREHLQNLYDKYSQIIQHIKLHNPKEDNSIILNILDYSITYLNKIVNISDNLKGLCMLVIYKDCEKPLQFISEKYTGPDIINDEISKFLAYYDENYDVFVSDIVLYSDEFYRDYPFVLKYLNKNAGE